MAHLQERPPSVRTARPELPAAVDGVLQRAMAKSPGARYATCGDFVRALGNALGAAGGDRTDRPGSRSAVWIGGAAALVIGAVVAGLVLFGGNHKVPANVPTPTTPTTPAASPVFIGIVRIDPGTRHVATHITTNLGIFNPGFGSGSIRTVAAGSGAVWVLNRSTGTVEKINPTANTIVAHVPLTLDIGFGGGIATLDGRLWVLSGIPNKPGAEFIAIDPTTDRASAPVEMAGQATPTTVTAGEGKLWALAGGSLYRIDPKTKDVRTSSLPGSLTDVAAGEGAVWVLDSVNAALIEIDPVTLAIRGHVPLPGSPRHVVAGGGAVWVLNGEGTVSRIPVGTNSGIDTIRVGPDPFALAVGPDAVWVANRGDGTVTRIDLVDSTTTTIKVGRTVDHIAVGEGAVWVAVPRGG